MSKDIFFSNYFEHNNKHCFIVCKIEDDSVTVRAYRDKDGNTPASPFKYSYTPDTKVAQEWRSTMSKSRVSHLVDFVKSDFTENRVAL